jgi:hypothetical protein
MTKKPTAPEIVGVNVDSIVEQPKSENTTLDWSKSLSELLGLEDQVRRAKCNLELIQASANDAATLMHGSKSLRDSIEQSTKQYQSLFSFSTPSESTLKFFEQEKNNYETLLERINGHEDIFKRLQDSMNSPESRGLSALLDILEGAQLNADIQNSKAALEVLEIFHTLVSMARLNASADEIIKPLIEHAEKSALSSMTRQNARKKNAPLRKWVREQWPKYKDKGYTKSRFARWCISNPPQSIPGRLPSVEQITRDWLK